MNNLAFGSKGYWTETNLERKSDNMNLEYAYLNEYAYPLNTIDNPQIMKRILEWGKTHHIYGLGRWGEHSHFNSDVTVGRAIDLANRLIYSDYWGEKNNGIFVNCIFIHIFTGDFGNLL